MGAASPANYVGLIILGWRFFPRVSAKMLFAAFGCQPYLFLPLGETCGALRADAGLAMRTADTIQIIIALHIGIAKWHTAGMTHVIAALPQFVINRDAPVKNKTFALPFALLCGHLFEIF
jgi:hypothetical protein